MKNKLKQLTKIGILLLGISFFFTNCQKEDVNLEPELQQNQTSDFPFQLKVKKYSELKTNSKFTGALSKFTKNKTNNSNTYARSAMEDEYGFTIDSTEIKEITTDEYTTYTFFIYKDSIISETYYENLVLKIDSSDITTAYIIKYNLNSEGTATEHDSKTLDATVNIKEIDYVTNELNVSAECVGILMCPYGGSSHPAGQACINADRGDLYLDTSMCGDSGGSTDNTGNNTGSTDGNTDTGNTGTGTSGGTGDGTNDGCDTCGSGSTGTGTGTGTGTDTGTGTTATSPINTSPKYLRFKDFKLTHLTLEQRNWLNSQDSSIQDLIQNYLEEQYLNQDLIIEEYPQEAVDFIVELYEVIHLETVVDNNALGFILHAESQDKIYNDIDSNFLLSVNQFLNIDTSDTELHDPIIIHILMKMALIRATQPNICDGLPEWRCDLKVFWEASKDVVHIVLDGIGLVPVVGEVADLINGGLYLLEGDGVNATLSFAATIPIAGWTATGTKYAIKIVDATQTASTIVTKVKLTWKVVGNTIEFGSSSLLRKVLGITDSALQAHHLIPWATRNHDVVQKAAKSGSAFHMNEALNGIAVASWRNQPNHNTYNNIIQNKLDTFNSLNPNATVDEAYDFVSDLIFDIRDWVINNPNSHLNDLVLP